MFLSDSGLCPGAIRLGVLNSTSKVSGADCIVYGEVVLCGIDGGVPYLIPGFVTSGMSLADTIDYKGKECFREY